ncbi:MAG: putative cytosol aminopeptidase [candidate division TM6 bacterium GW2011_GWF2_30_66]|nr:MAG: putative cytosol aminopeptidase [candidate division TM6 bacterium GW2011_GWF2_30_66]
MIDFKFSSEKLFDQKFEKSVKADCYVMFLKSDFDFSKDLQEIERKYLPNLEAFFALKDFKGEAKSSLLMHATDKKEIFHTLFLGLGKANSEKDVKDKNDKNKKNKSLKKGSGILEIENLRRALGVLIRVVEKNKFKNIVIELPSAELFGVTEEFFAKQIATILNMANYHFDCFITTESCKLPKDYNIILIADKSRISALKAGLHEGEIIGEAVNIARHAIDLPAANMNPQDLVNLAKAIAKENKLKITVFDEEDIIKMGMGGLAAVSKGSDRDCALVIMEYKTSKKNASTLAFVGKGITFDSGGLSLKPANSMETMKEDMSGAAAVIASMEAFAKLKPEVNIICVAPISENLPSGKATKPGDIITFYNGKTAEVRNTDAEGRLILADALSYVEDKYKPDIIIDLATLTGACQYALGHFYCGMMSKDTDLISKVQKASDLSGDRVWNLPFHDDYKAAIKSSVADICNIGSPKYMAGTVTAGFFLSNFVDHTPWLHLDIAGTAFNVPDMPYYRDGATGFGVRLLVELVCNWNK